MKSIFLPPGMNFRNFPEAIIMAININETTKEVFYLNKLKDKICTLTVALNGRFHPEHESQFDLIETT